MYDADKFDVAGFAVGVAEESALIRPQNITVGDVIIALASDGAHSNGLFINPPHYRKIAATALGVDGTVTPNAQYTAAPSPH